MREGERREMREERGRNPKSLEVYVRQKTKPVPLFVEKHAPLEFGHRTRKCQWHNCVSHGPVDGADIGFEHSVIGPKP